MMLPLWPPKPKLFDIVGPGYFDAVGIPLVKGRDVEAREVKTRGCEVGRNRYR